MTLFRQLILVIFALFLLVFVGTLYISISTTRHYLAEQLESHAQDTATSLGLSIAPYLQKKDVAAMETMVNAIFDSGYYRQIRIEALSGTPLVTRKNPSRIEGIPQWFIDLIPLETPIAKSEVTTGWMRSGAVVVQSNPGFAYIKLWQTSFQLFWWFLAAILGSLILGWIVIHILLRPLREVTRQAEAITNREYPLQKRMPWTTELKIVVEAMNRMVSKVKMMFEKQASLTEQLRSELYHDVVSGMGNRRYFDAQLHNLIEAPEEFFSGTLTLVELDNFKEFNDQHGYEAGDQVIKQVAILLRQACAAVPASSYSRIGGATFAIISPNVAAEEAKQLGENISHALGQLQSTGLYDYEDVGHVGIASYMEGQEPADLLAEADMALRTAQTEGVNAWHFYSAENIPAQFIHTHHEWKEYIEKLIETKDIVLNFQRIEGTKPVANNALHWEVLLRVPDHQGHLISAGIILPMVERLGYHQEIDKLVIEDLTKYLKTEGPQKHKFAVNLSVHSVHQPEFVEWLYQRMRSLGTAARQFVFELPEYAAVNDLQVVKNFVDKIIKTGAHVALDHMGRGFASFGYLSGLKLEYLKIDGGYIRGIHQNKNNQFFVKSLVDIAHSLDMKVIAEAVESANERDVLLDLHLDGLQGYFIAPPVNDI